MAFDTPAAAMLLWWWRRIVLWACRGVLVLALVGVCIPLTQISAAGAQQGAQPTSPALVFPLRAIHASGNWGNQ